MFDNNLEREVDDFIYNLGQVSYVLQFCFKSCKIQKIIYFCLQLLYIYVYYVFEFREVLKVISLIEYMYVCLVYILYSGGLFVGVSGVYLVSGGSFLCINS